MGAEDVETPLLQPSSKETAKPLVWRNGNIWTALAHIITAVIGSGVLSLAWSMSRLGWVAGPTAMLLFASVSLVSTYLLCNCYRSPDPDLGPSRNGSYLEAVQIILGKRNAAVCGVIVGINFVKVGIVYTITSAICMRAILKSTCYHDRGHDAPCEYSSTNFMLLFGLVQIFVSQVPDFRNTQWLSVVAALMSFTYSIIGSGLGFTKIIENGEIKGSITGVPASNTAEKLWSIAQAVGDIAFAFPFSLIFLEIQDTMRSPPPEKVTMKKASATAVCITTFFYLCCGGFGYAAFGNSTPGNLLTGFGFYEPYWLVNFANACVVLHLVGGYQVFSQPLFAAVERRFAIQFPDSGIVQDIYRLKLPLLPTISVNLLRVFFRTAYVVMITSVGMLFPYFNQVVGLAGAINFWPVVIYFPVEMYLVQKNIGSWTAKWVILRGYSIICLIVIVFAFIGSVKGLISARFG